MHRPEKPRANRRRSARKPARRATRAYCYGPMGLGPNLAVRLLDVSETGARLLLKEGVAVGGELEVHLTCLARARPVRLRADVVWCVPAAVGGFCVGAQFRRPLSFRDLHDL